MSKPGGKKGKAAKRPVKRAAQSNASAPKKRRYEGAAKSKRLSRWTAPSTSANDAIGTGLVTLRNRARDLRRNNPYAAKGIQAITSNVVGPGITTQFRGDAPEALEALWAAWAETFEIDFDGRNNIYGLERLIMDAVAESGEVLVRRRFVASKDFPLQYQVLESDFLDASRTEAAAGGNYIVQGIEFDEQGRRVAYYLFESHPGATTGTLVGAVKSNRVPAEDVLHIFRMERPGQARGVTWLAPILVRVKDLDEYEDAQLMRQKIAACFTVFVRDIGAPMDDEDEECPDELGERVEPGIIEHLPNGKTVEFAKPPEVTGYGEYVATVLYGIAAGLGITYEALTGDLSKVNYSSGRMGWLEFGRNIKTWRDTLMIGHFLNPVCKEFMRFAALKGVSTKGLSYVHVAPAREMIDPAKEISATVESIKAGLTTLSDELMAQGKDPVAHLDQYKKDMDTLDRLGLKLESDPRNAQGGAGQATQTQGDASGNTQNENPV